MPRSRGYESLPAQRYVEIRKVLGAPYRQLPAAEIEALFASANLSAEDLENSLEIFGDIGKAFSQVGRAVAPALQQAGREIVKRGPQILSGAAQGAMTGAAMGPWGALGGALLGGLGGGLSGPPASQPPAPPQTATQPTSPQMPTQMPAQMPMPAAGGGSPAAAQLMGMLARPEVLQSLMSMAMGQAGRQNISVGGTQVPVGAFANLLGVLSNRAAEEYNAVAAQGAGWGEAVPAYLRNYAGEAYGDIAMPEQRAAALWELLLESEPEQDDYYALGGFARGAYDENEPEDYDRFYDELEWSEFAGRY
jgi:hypothetical protein